MVIDIPPVSHAIQVAKLYLVECSILSPTLGRYTPPLDCNLMIYQLEYYVNYLIHHLTWIIIHYMPYRIKYKRGCKACGMCKGHPKLRARITQAAFNRDLGDETITNIAEEIGVSVPALMNHVKKHIIMIEEDTINAVKETRVQKNVINLQAQAQKEAELIIDMGEAAEVEGRPEEIIALDTYISQGYDEIKKGQLKVTPNSFLAAVKIKNDWSSKQSNNKIELLKTIAAFRSGHKKTIDEQVKQTPEGEVVNDSSTETTGSVDTGETRPDNIYRAIIGNVTSRGPEEVHSSDSETE